MEILCAIHNCGETIENLWNICGSFMEILCASDGKVMEI